MKRLLITIMLVVTLQAPVTLGQTRKISGPSPRDIVEEIVWTMGVSGQLLSGEGWNRASGYFVEPNPMPQDKSFDIISNDSGFSRASIEGDMAEVDMGFTDAGHVDSNLRYSPPRPTRAFKTERVFRLTLTPGSIRMFGPDGKTELESKPTGDWIWEIEGPLKRWTTVNTAIRYVLEMKNKTTDPAIKKNADETIAQLLMWP